MLTWKKLSPRNLPKRELRKQDYYAQRQRAREYARQFDLIDKEIERRLDEEDRI
ncbi:hypothetical protein [Desulfosporosinus fructosivorans]|uniref:hypothetical protein n=1 Tax=Desulfosporosinus fructosivorans TaxID=2018669 RepID=UPI00130EECE0|nr:hypothetical protein [Desulfosporosinus fructosivorans]